MNFGSSKLGLSYSLIFTEFFISPFIPSITARGGGIIFPIAQSLVQIYANIEDKGQVLASNKKMSAFIIQVCFHCNVITGGLFLTAMAGNPIAVTLAANLGIAITWLDWAKGAVLIGIINLLLLPILLSLLIPTSNEKNSKIVEIAKTELKKIGALKFNEIIVLITFLSLMLLWSIGNIIGIDAVTASFIGVSILLASGSLTWDEIINEKNAWGTLVWLGVLVGLSQSLGTVGLIGWINGQMQLIVGGSTGAFVIAAVVAIYFFMHYFFASSIVMITVIYSSFIVILIKLGIPPFVAALSLAILANISGGLTHFGTGTAPIYYGTGFLTIGQWWKIGAVVGLFNLLLWSILTPIWWKWLGWW